MLKTVLLAAFLLAPFAPQSGVTISGTVVREDRQAIPATTLIRLSGPTSTVVQMGSDGSFEFKNVQPGTYQAAISSAASVSATIVVGSADITGYKLVVPIVVNVPGTMAVDNGGLRPRFQLTFTPLSGTPINLSAGSTFTAQLPPGEYRLTASAIPAGYTLKSITSGVTDLRTQTLKITEGDAPKIAIEMGVTSPPPWVKLSGHITGYSPATTLTLTGTNVGETLSAPLGADGSFDFPRVLPGTYSGRVTPLSTATVGISISIVVGDKDLTNVSIAMPGASTNREVAGRVIIEGNAPMPRLIAVTLSAPLTTAAATPGTPASSTPGTVTISGAGGTSTASASLAPDGAFKLSLPEGERQFNLLASQVPTGYKIKSMTYGSVDLMKSPIHVAGGDTAELKVTFDAGGVTMAKVSGRLIGINPALISGSVSLTGSTAALPALDAAINPDGTFVFPSVLPGTYTARLTAPGVPATAATTSVVVTNKDVTGVEISVPRDVSGHIAVDGGGPIPRFTLPLTSVAAGAGGTSLAIAPQADGSFRTALPLGERKVGAPTGLPAGYTVKSITYGTVDLLKDTLKVAASDSAEMSITLGVSSTATPWMNVSGRVTGPAFPQGVRLVLTGSSLGSPLETPLGADGSFTFSKLLPGSYVARVSLSGLRETTASISVGNKDVTGITIAVPQQLAIAGQVIVEGAPNGFVSPPIVLEAKSATGATVSSSGSTPGKPFLFTLEPGSHTISVRSLPAGYRLKSLIYGTTDLLKEPLKLDGPVPWEIIVRLTH